MQSAELTAVIVTGIIGISVPITVAIIKMLPKKNNDGKEKESTPTITSLLRQHKSEIIAEIIKLDGCTQSRVCDERFKSFQAALMSLQNKLDGHIQNSIDERKELRTEIHELRDVVQRWLARDPEPQQRRQASK